MCRRKLTKNRRRMPRKFKITQSLRQIIFWFFLTTVTSGFAESKEIPILSSIVEKRIEFFYLNSSSKEAVDIIKLIIDLNEVGPRICYVGALLQAYPEQILRWLKESKIKIEENPPLIYALWMAGLTKEAVSAAVKANWSVEVFSEPAGSILEVPIENMGIKYPSLMTAFFMVTGDTRYISKIINVLDLNFSEVLPFFKLRELKEEAMRCLKELIARDKVVYQFCLSESYSHPGKGRHMLIELVKEH